MVVVVKKLPNELKAKNRTFKLYDWEIEKVKAFIKTIRKNPVELDENEI